MSSPLTSALDRFASVRVLCIGDVMLDTFVYGQVERISPEAPIPVFSIREERSMLGGAGNVARNLVSLGANVSFVSVIGSDKAGHSIASMVGKEARVTAYLIPETGRTSTTKIRYVASSQQVLRADHETQAPLAEDTARRLVDVVKQEIKNHDVVLLSDYGKGVLSRVTLPAIITAARDAGKPVIVDPKSRDFSLYQGASCVCPNLQELAAASLAELSSEKAIADAAQSLMERNDIGHILVTRSREGMTLVTRKSEAHHIPAQAREVYDVSGAGDTAIAMLALCVAAGCTYEEAAHLANTAAGIVVGRLGTAVVTVDDLRTALFMESHPGGSHKIAPQEEARARAQQWQREGRKVGFTNGCFDLMHPGHLALLQEARKHCERLIVGLNSDASVSRIKGPQRPVNGQSERALLLASLSDVDMVTIFDEDTPRTLIEALRPDVLVKGADYQKHEVVGHEMVERWGGKVVLAPIKEGYSTTNLIKKLA